MLALTLLSWQQSVHATTLTCAEIVQAKAPGLAAPGPVYRVRVKYQGPHGLRVADLNYSLAGNKTVLKHLDGSPFTLTSKFVILSGDQAKFKSPHSDLSMAEQLLKKPVADLTDLAASDSGLAPSLMRKLAPLSESSTESERLAAIESVALADLTINPGHALVRSRAAIIEMITSITMSKLKTPTDEKDMIKLNVITNGDGTIRSVDSWDGHHRLVALLASGSSGATRIGDLDPASVLILVNGVDTRGKEREHRLPISGINVSMTERVQTTPSSKVGTIVYSGRIANFDLGSRTTLGKLKRNMLERKEEPRIGVIAIERAPISRVLLASLERIATEFDSLVLIPVGSTAKVRQLNKLISQVQKSQRLNLYLGSLAEESKYFSWQDVVLARLGQIYGTYDIQLIH